MTERWFEDVRFADTGAADMMKLRQAAWYRYSFRSPYRSKSRKDPKSGVVTPSVGFALANHDFTLGVLALIL
jgi:hypothetical protein